MPLPLIHTRPTSTVHVHLNLPFFTSSVGGKPPQLELRDWGVLAIIREITHGCSFTKQQHNIQENIEHHSSTLSISSSDLHHLFCFSACPSFTFSYSSFIYQVIAHKSSKPFFFPRCPSALCVTCLSLRLGSIVHLWVILSPVPWFHVHHPSAVSLSWF